MSTDGSAKESSWRIGPEFVWDDEGYYDQDDPDREPRQAAKRLFLETYRKKTRNQVVGDLFAIFRSHRRLISSDHFSPVFSRLFRVLPLVQADQHDEVTSGELQALEAELSGWAVKHRLTKDGRPASWVIEVAITAFERWLFRPRRRRWETFLPVALSRARPSQLGNLEITITPWRMGESKKDFRQRARSSFMKAISEYLQMCGDGKWTKRRRPEQERDIDWLVGRLQGDSLAQLVTGDPPKFESEESKISKDVGRAAEFLDLDRPPSTGPSTT